MDVASNDYSLTEIRKYFAILIFADSYWPRKLEDRENFRVYVIQNNKHVIIYLEGSIKVTYLA